MLTLKEIVRNTHDSRQKTPLDESTNDLPALLTLKRGTIRTLSDGKKIAEYHHADSGFSIIYPMMFSKGDKQ